MSVLFAGLVAGATMFALTLVPLAMNSRRAIKRRIDAAVAPRPKAEGAETATTDAGEGLRGGLEEVYSTTQARFGRTRAWRALESIVERGDIPMRTVEALYTLVGGSISVFMFATLFGYSTWMALLFVVVLLVVVRIMIGVRIARRVRAFEDQLPDILAAVASALRAGHSFTQALAAVAADAEEPSAHEFGRVLVETRLGRPVDDALAALGRRMGSKDLDFVLTAVMIQRQVGGSVAGLFDGVSETVRQRRQFTRKLRGLTAMGRASAGLLIALPFGLGAMLTVTNPAYMSPLYSTGLGRMMIAAALVSMAIGSTWLRRIVAVHR